MTLQSVLIERLLLLPVVLFLLVPNSAHARFGGGSDGGGNLEEGDFRETAHQICLKLNANPALTMERLGISSADFCNMLTETQVQCAYEPILSEMRSLNKFAYYRSELNGIYLDCANYFRAANKGSAKNTLVFHEYMRKLVHEGSEYSVASRLNSTLIEIRRRQLLDAIHVLKMAKANEQSLRSYGIRVSTAVTITAGTFVAGGFILRAIDPAGTVAPLTRLLFQSGFGLASAGLVGTVFFVVIMPQQTASDDTLSSWLKTESGMAALLEKSELDAFRHVEATGDASLVDLLISMADMIQHPERVKSLKTSP